MQKTPGGALLLESVKGERERAGGQGKGVGQGPQAQAAAANTSVFSFLQGKSGHLLSPIPVLIKDDPKPALNRGNGILFSLCQNTTIKYLEQIHSFFSLKNDVLAVEVFFYKDTKIMYFSFLIEIPFYLQLSVFG